MLGYHSFMSSYRRVSSNATKQLPPVLPSAASLALSLPSSLFLSLSLSLPPSLPRSLSLFFSLSPYISLYPSHPLRWASSSSVARRACLTRRMKTSSRFAGHVLAPAARAHGRLAAPAGSSTRAAQQRLPRLCCPSTKTWLSTAQDRPAMISADIGAVGSHKALICLSCKCTASALALLVGCVATFRSRQSFLSQRVKD